MLVMVFAAFSQSSNYQLHNYSIGSGGTNNASSSTYQLNASTGEVTSGSGSGSTQQNLPGELQAQQANVPLAPTLDNGSNTYYNKLNCIINQGGTDASDYTYAIAVSTTSGFTSTSYVQADGTLGSSAVYRSYSAWGGASGSFIVGLLPSTTYYVKVAAMQGQFTNSAFGPSANKATVNPAITFSLSPANLNLGSLLAGSVISGGTNISIAYSTNGATGGNIYIAGQNVGLKSVAANNTISAVSADLSLGTQPQGFGVEGTSATATTGTFSFASPFNGTGDVVGAPTLTFQPILTSPGALTGGSATAVVKAKAANTTPAGADYQEILTFVASANF